MEDEVRIGGGSGGRNTQDFACDLARNRGQKKYHRNTNDISDAEGSQPRAQELIGPANIDERDDKSHDGNHHRAHQQGKDQMEFFHWIHDVVTPSGQAAVSHFSILSRLGTPPACTTLPLMTTPGVLMTP